MKILSDDAAVVDVDPATLDRGTDYEFPCGCRFAVAPGEPDVHGHRPLIYDDEHIPLDCPAVYAMLGAGLTKGVFQLESPLGHRYCKKLQPETIEHLAALNAILRPGCLKVRDDQGVSTTDRYCLRKNGLDPVSCEFEALRPILEPTYGLMIYQEQAMRIAVDLAGFTLTDADELRKAIGKKKADLMAQVRVKFLDGAERLGVITRAEAGRLFDDIEKSQRYSFNASHAFSYAINTYRSAHWKAHHPIYFFTSYLYWAKEKQDPLREVRQLVAEARRFAIAVVNPAFAELRTHFGTDGVRVSFGLADIKGIGEKAVHRMREQVPAREVRFGPRTSWSWYTFLVGFSDACGATVVRRMIEAGALAAMGPVRQRLLAEYEAYHRLTDKEREKLAGLGSPVPRMVPAKRTIEARVVKWPSKFRKADRQAFIDQLDPELRADWAEAAIARFGAKTVPQAVPLEDQDGEPVLEVARDRDGRPVIDPARPVDHLEDGLRQLLERPGAVTPRRRPVVATILELLTHPPTPHADAPGYVARREQDLLGVPITYQPIATADRSEVNASVADFKAGRDPRDGHVLGVEVHEIYEKTVQNGDNRGRPWATLLVSDETGTMDDVVVFPDAWERYGLLLLRPGSLVAIGGKRSYKDRDSFIVEDVRVLA